MTPSDHEDTGMQPDAEKATSMGGVTDPPQRVNDLLAGAGQAAEPAAEAQPDAVKKAGRIAKLDAIIRAWVLSHIHGSPVARNTEALNHLNAALPVLRDSILKEET